MDSPNSRTIDSMERVDDFTINSLKACISIDKHKSNDNIIIFKFTVDGGHEESKDGKDHYTVLHEAAKVAGIILDEQP